MRRERGHSPAVEAAVIVPGLVLLVGLLIVAAQVVLVRQEVASIAAAAARAASLERSVQAGERAALEHVRAGLSGTECADERMDVDVAGLSTPLGVPGEVVVEVRCTVSLSAVSLPFMPGSVEVEARRESPVDRYRAR